MRKRKMIVIITAFIVIILAIGSFMLVRGIGKTPMSDDQKYERIQVSETRNPANFTVADNNKEKKSNNQKKESENSSMLSIPPISFADKSEAKAVSASTSSDAVSQKDKEKGGYSKEEEEKLCLALMHERGWYKPEDVPIIHE